MSLWDSVVSSASKAVTQAVSHAGEATHVAATKAKLHADILMIDRDIKARQEKFGVDMYTHLEKITSTQEFYVAEDRLINVLRPTLIRAQREVAAYEKKRDSMKGKVSLAEVNRCSTGSILTAETVGQKLYNAASFISAGAKEAACKTELAMLERQILGFKEEFGVELYPVFQSLEDNEGWLPTDRKVRSLYDQARDDIVNMEKSKEDKREQIKNLDKAEGKGFASPAMSVSQTSMSAPTVVATPLPSNFTSNTVQLPWDYPSPDMSHTTTAIASYGTSYGSSQPPTIGIGAPQPLQESFQFSGQNQQFQQPASNNQSSSFQFIQSQPRYSESSISSQMGVNSMDSFQQPPQQMQPLGTDGRTLQCSVFDPFDSIGSNISNNNFICAPHNSTPSPAPTNQYQFDQFPIGSRNSSSSKLSDADMNLFKY